MQILDSGRKFIVNLKTCQCDCTNFKEYALLYTHAIVACRHEVEDPFDYADWIYSVKAYRATYHHFLLPVNIDNLPSNNRVLPLEFKKQRGRPPTKRIRKGAWRRKTMHCSNCHGTDHNIWKCRHAPALHGRQQRARDHESSTSSSASSINGALSDLDSDDLQDREWQAKMDCYDELYARADAVRERERQRLQVLELEALKDNDAINRQSDSELLVLASSLFNSMDGIELS